MTTDAHFSHTLSFVGANLYADRLWGQALVFSTHKGQLLTSMRYVRSAVRYNGFARRDEEEHPELEETQSQERRRHSFCESALPHRAEGPRPHRQHVPKSRGRCHIWREFGRSP